VPVIDDQAQSKSKFGFLEREVLVEFLTGFKIQCPIPRCGCFFENIEVRDWCMCYSIHFTCGNGHKYSWQTGKPKLEQTIPRVKHLAFHGALASGMTYTQFAEFFSTIGFHIPHKSTFYKFQRGSAQNIGWCDAALRVWDNNKQQVQNELRAIGSPILAYVDTRYDSSRFAYHGTTPVIHADSGKVIELVTKTRIEVGSSWLLEDAGTEEAFMSLYEAGVIVGEVVHDDKLSVDSILQQRGIINQKDLWHKCKKLIFKFRKDLSEKKKTRPSGVGLQTATSYEDVRRCNMDTLKAWHRGKNLSVGGKKEQLVERVVQAMGISFEQGAGSSSSSQSPLEYPELVQHNIAVKLKSWIYKCCRITATSGHDDVTTLVKNIRNAADHWAGNHSICAEIDSSRKCVQHPHPEKKKFVFNSKTHIAVKQWLIAHITENKFVFYTWARENYLSESFHSLINKYASKRIHFLKSHKARIACAALDWNENRSKECLKVVEVRTTDNTVRNRPPHKRVLTDKTHNWKNDVKTLLSLNN
jgi:hypothetical protein